ncbi:ribonuclease Z [Gorillibacterium timonense]|uniref:ribonuclease Z n=1 Tax=Gorillibacterium timonense TaxID=1689269 RepID=UPI00071C6A33|nr:ribonuclease Z [Gorillibacterium timonense]
MELTFLGTGAGTPTKFRNVTSSVLNLQKECGVSWMFDCGEGTQHQLLHSSLRMSRMTKLFVTHLHGDHIFGIPGLLSTRSNHGAELPLVVYGPKGIADYIQTSLRLSESRMKYPVTIVEIDEGVIFEDEYFTVEAARVDHRIECFGFRVCEKDRPGTLDADALKADGVPAGPHFAALKRGETVILSDGRRIDGARYVGPVQPGRIVAIIGDTRPHPSSIRLAEEADLLVHEATFTNDKVDMAFDYGHSTARQAAEIAMKANVRRLVMTHVSARYQGGEEALLQEAREIFPASDYAEDFLTVSVERRRSFSL